MSHTRVTLDSTRIMLDGQQRAITPGMAMTAENKARRRRVTSLRTPMCPYAHDPYAHERSSER
jgi:hypothetical protein